jgi:uncharacterized protein (DUF2141 family)
MSRVALDGTYDVGELPPGEYSVMAFFAGYVSPTDEINTDDIGFNSSPAKMRELMLKFASVTIHGAETETFDITLLRGASISGRMFYSDGSPAVQVSVEVEDIKNKPPKTSGDSPNLNRAALARASFTHQPQFTDDQGRYRISGLKPGSYRVAAIETGGPAPSFHNEFGPSSGGGVSSAADVRVYAGDTLQRKSAKVYELRAGDDVTGVDITIHLDIFHIVHGTLTARDGRPINSAEITLTDTIDDAFTFKTLPGRDGSFSFDAVPSGTYALATDNARIVAIPADAIDTTPRQSLHRSHHQRLRR